MAGVVETVHCDNAFWHKESKGVPDNRMRQSSLNLEGDTTKENMIL